MKKNKGLLLISFLLLATPILSLFGSNLSILEFKLMTSNKNQAVIPNHTFVPSSNPNDGQLWSSSTGLAGDITARPVIDYHTSSGTTQVVYIGTELGLSKIEIETRNLYWFLATPGPITSITSVEDISNNGIKDVLITIDNQQFANVEMVEGLNGEILWSFSPTVNVWVEGIGFSNEETRSWSGLQIQDLTSDGIDEVLISSFKTVYALDGVDGELIWQHSASDDIWSMELMDTDIDSDGVKEITIGSQDGELELISGKTGDVVWSIIAAAPIEIEDTSQGMTYAFDQNVYELFKTIDFNGDNKKDIFVTTETGYAAVYDILTGSLIKRIKAFTRSGVAFSETNYGSSSFYNLLAFETNTISSSTQILTSGWTTSSFGNSSLTLLTLSQNSLNVEWCASAIDITNIRHIATNPSSDSQGDFTRMIVPVGESGSSNLDFTIEIYCLENRSLIDQWEITVAVQNSEIGFDFGDKSSLTYPFQGNYAFFVDDFSGTDENEVLIYLSGGGLFVVDGEEGELLWRLTSATKSYIEPFVDINSDSTIEILRKDVYSPDKHRFDRYYIPRLSLIDGASGDVLWEHEMAVKDQQSTNGGYNQIIEGDDITGDGIPDFWLGQYEFGYQESSLSNSSKVKLLDGSSGEIVWESLPTNPEWVYSKQQLQIQSICPIADSNSDGKQDVLVACRHSIIYCLSGEDGSYLWNITREGPPEWPNHRDWVPWNPNLVNLGNIIGVSGEEIAILGDGRIILVDEDFDSFLWSWDYSEGWFDEEYYITHLDQDENEYYLVLSAQENDQQKIVFLNLLTGSVAMEIDMDLHNVSWQFFVADFNNDGTRDHIMLLPWGGNEEFKEGYYIISGKTGNLISFYTLSTHDFDNHFHVIGGMVEMGMNNFADAIDDQNGDGKPDLVVGWSVGEHGEEEEAQGMVLEIVDMSSPQGVAIEKIEFVTVDKQEWAHPPLIPAAFVKNLGDLSGDGNNEVIVSLITPEQEIVSIILNIGTGTIWKTISSLPTSSLDPALFGGALNGNLVFTDLQGRIRAMRSDFSVEITTLERQKGNAGKYKISWNCATNEIYSSIYLDNEIVASVFGSIETEICLSRGMHTVTVAVTDRNGISAFDIETLNVRKVGGVIILWIIIGIIGGAYGGLKIFLWKRPKEDLTYLGPTTIRE